MTTPHDPARVWATYQCRIEGLARRLTGSAEDAAEVASDVAVALVRGLHAFQGRSSLGTWVFRVTVNAARQLLRRRRRRREVPLGAPAVDRGPEPGARMMLDELRQTIKVGTARLSPGERLLLLMSRSGWCPAFIAQELRLSLPCVKSRLLRARAALRVQLAAAL
jgi:RNA polymerase sigma-70 factor (ECF subfamily)